MDGCFAGAFGAAGGNGGLCGAGGFCADGDGCLKKGRGNESIISGFMANIIGAYGDWAAGLVADPPRLSLRKAGWASITAWQSQARARYLQALLQPDSGGVPNAAVQHHIQFDGLDIEQLTWQLPYGPLGRSSRPSQAPE